MSHTRFKCDNCTFGIFFAKNQSLIFQNYWQEEKSMKRQILHRVANIGGALPNSIYSDLLAYSCVDINNLYINHIWTVEYV